MMNLSEQKKKLFSKIALILGSLVIIAISYWGLTSVINDYKADNALKKKKLIEMYESKIDSIRIVSGILTQQVDSLEKEIAVIQGQKIYVYVDKTKTDKIIKDASASEHAQAIDSLTKQVPTWAVVKDSISKDTIIQYKLTKPGAVNLRLYVNDLKQYKGLYAIDEQVIMKQNMQIMLQETIIAGDKVALKESSSALNVSTTENTKLTKQLNKAQKRSGRWPYWLGVGVIGGVTACLLIQ